VVLEGEGGSVRAVDEIRFESVPTGTRIHYSTDLTFSGVTAWAEPLLRPALDGVGRRALTGLRQALSSEPAAPEPSLVTAALDCLVLPGLLRFTTLGYRSRKACFAPLAVSLKGRTVVLTGATSGLGRAAAENLARLGARVVLVGRDAERTRQTRDAIRSATGNTNLAVEVADLSLLSDVQRLADRLLARERAIHVLVNNAAGLENERRSTREGNETSLATNLLAPFVLTRLLVPRLRESAPARIVNVVSGGMYLAGLGPEVFGQEGTSWNGDVAYARHKRALMVLTETWAQELEAEGVAVNAMHPGWAETPGVARSLPLFLRLTRPFLRTPEEGADTIVWLAAAPEAARQTGGLWLDREQHPAAILPGTGGTPEERRQLVERLSRWLPGPAAPRGRRSRDAARARVAGRRSATLAPRSAGRPTRRTRSR
jgi:NAD(P)-dependent dehydrogenase (short-subunit alcohol dehydrogenase family)